MLSKRRLGCVATVLFGIITMVIIRAQLRRQAELEWKRHIEHMRQSFRDSYIAEVRSGERTGVEIRLPVCLEDLVAEVDCVPKVRWMHIWMADLSDERWRLVKQFPQLERISFYDSRGADTFFRNIQGMESVESLNMQQTGVSDEGLQYIATLPDLKSLEVRGPAVTNAGIGQLRGHAALETLVLVNTNVTDEGLGALKDLPRLRSLVLCDETPRGLTFTDAGLEHLKELTSLEDIELSGGWASEAAVRDLQEALPECKIETTRWHY